MNGNSKWPGLFKILTDQGSYAGISSYRVSVSNKFGSGIKVQVIPKNKITTFAWDMTPPTVDGINVGDNAFIHTDLHSGGITSNTAWD